ncbi:MAG TPA: hypothetical protein VGS96_08065 [Thermoanaerobaculia bacterium]|jgi:hypothetical protein|nr:hypothetical protein [Thermoanaerobaculia bacterium]
MFRFSSILMMAAAIALMPADGSAGIKFPWQSKAKVRASAKVQTKEIARVERDVQRLESLLATAKTSTKLSQKSWKSVVSEATMLADRIYTNVKSATKEKAPVRDAEKLRTHVQNMKKEAERGDYRNTQRHAARALTVATRLDEWAG